MDDVRQRVMEAKKLSLLTLLSVTVRCGNRSATFFVDPALADIEPFYYLNCFGVSEHLSLQRVTTSKEYEVESAPLTSDECLQVEQMFTSPTVRIPFGIYAVQYETDFDALTTILITDFTSEISDTNEKPNSVKFTWRFAENRPKVNIPTSPGIFNDKFQPPFS